MRARRITALLAFSLTVGGLLAPQAANAISRAAAQRLALRILRPPSAGQVVVFALPRPIPRRSYVFEDDTGAKAIAQVAVKRLRRRAWLFWEDLQYGAKFEHASILLLLDAGTGARISMRRMRWWPLLNGRRLPFDDAPGYWDPRYQIASTPGTLGPGASARLAARVLAPFALAAEAPKPIAVAPGAFDGDCVIDIGRDGDARTAGDFERLDALEQRLKDAHTGLQAYAASSNDEVPKDPSGNPSRPQNAADGSDLKRDVNTMVHDLHCKDIFIYIDGHGAETGVARVQVGARDWKKKSRPEPDGTQLFTGHHAYVTADDLRDILKAQRQTTFKIKIDACFAGRFLLDLPKTEFPNLLTLEASSNAVETSSFSLPERTIVGPDGKQQRTFNPTNNPGNQVITVPDPHHPGKTVKRWDRRHGLSEFSNGNFSALETFLTDPTLVAEARAQGGPLLARALEYAAQHSDAQDWAAQQGLTHPKFETNIPTGTSSPNTGPSSPNSPPATTPPVGTPSKASDCEQPLTGTLTTPTSGPGSGLQHVQIEGQCRALLPRLKKLRVTPRGGKQIAGYDAHSPSCAPQGGSLPAPAITCVVKDDGRICLLLYLQPAAQPGDVLHVELLGDGDQILDALDLVVPSGQQPTCKTGD